MLYLLQSAPGIEGTGFIVGLITIVFLIGLYFLPTFVAYSRKQGSAGAIFVLNLFLGWSFIGWIAALIWSLKSEHQVAQNIYVNQGAPESRNTENHQVRT